jgi:hypothetical protein
MREAVGAGFTAVLCTAPACGTGDEGTVAERLIEALRGVVRTSRLGVLVTTGCLCGEVACGVRAKAPVVLVQACDADRRPTGLALLVGPLRTNADVEALASWLRSGRLDPGELPERMLTLHRQVTAAPMN